MSDAEGPRYRRVDGVVHRWFEGEILVLVSGDEVRRLAGAAASVFDVLHGDATVEEIDQRLREVVAAPPAGAVADGLAALVEGGLVEVRTSS